jgi:sarcosine oxidase subunit alpha
MSGVVRFSFDGREVPASPGQTIAGALYAAGVRTLSWSPRYRRPRGLRCGTGACPGCTVAVGGARGIQACITPVVGGEVVERIRPWLPWLPADRLGFLVPAGFQSSRWLRPAPIWHIAEPVLARLAGQGPPPSPSSPLHRTASRAEDRVVDVLVVGGGERGLRAATLEAAAGRSVLLVDRGPEPGGRLLDRRGGAAVARALADAARAAGVEVLARATSLGTFDDGVDAVVADERLVVVRAGRVVRETGSLDREVVLPDGDRPGVLLASAVERLIAREGVSPGRRAVIVATGDGEATADSLEHVLAVVGTRVVARCEPGAVVAIHGRSAVRAVSLARGRIRCDLVVVAAGRRPADELDRQEAVPVEPHVP